MVVTFDDAYRSFIEQALPILREEGVKATLAVVTSFIDRPPPGMPPLMTWDQIQEAERSGFVEIASHSHDLHKYETSNPYRDSAPSAVTRRYLLEVDRYEDRKEYLERIREDLRESQRILREKLGHDVSVLAWPYGEHNAAARGIAAEEGFRVTLGLGGIDVRPEDLRSGLLPRVMVVRGSRIGGKDPGWL
jgi:biofilm PGA synthesis lipoprotein PgaB